MLTSFGGVISTGTRGTVNSDAGGSSRSNGNEEGATKNDDVNAGTNNNVSSFSSSSDPDGNEQLDGDDDDEALPMEPDAEYRPARSSWLFPPSIVGRPPSPPPPAPEVEEEQTDPQEDRLGLVAGQVDEHLHGHAAEPPLRVVDPSEWQRVIIEDDTTALTETYGSFQHVFHHDQYRGDPDGRRVEVSQQGRATGGGIGHLDSQLGRGVLILDGLSHEGSFDAAGGGGGDDPSALSIPGSVPSDPGTIHHSDEEDHTSDANWHLNHLGSNIRHCARQLFASSAAAATATSTPTISNTRRNSASNKNSHSRHCRTTNHQHRPNGDTANHRDTASAVIGRRGLWSTVAVAILVVGGGGMYRHQQRLAEEQRALKQALKEVETLQLENERLMREEEALRIMLAVAQEEARAAAAAELQKKELLRLNTSGSRRGKSGGNNNSQKEDEDDAYDGPDEEFDWSDGDDCHADEMSSFNILDNCWVKAKAKVQIGACGDGTLDYFKDLWNGLWDNIDSGLAAITDHQWRLLYDETVEMNAHGEKSSTNKDQGGEDDGHYSYYDYQEDYIQHDPLAGVMEAIQSAGQTVGAKFAQMMKDEAARAANVEEAVHGGLVQASDAVKEAMNDVKRDVQELSREALTALHTLVKKHQNSPGSNADMDPGMDVEPESVTDSDSETDEKESHITSMQFLTRQGLSDAASALSAFTKTLQETVASLSLPTHTSAETLENGDKKKAQPLSSSSS